MIGYRDGAPYGRLGIQHLCEGTDIARRECNDRMGLMSVPLGSCSPRRISFCIWGKLRCRSRFVCNCCRTPDRSAHLGIGHLWYKRWLCNISSWNISCKLQVLKVLNILDEYMKCHDAKWVLKFLHNTTTLNYHCFLERLHSYTITRMIRKKLYI